MRMLALAWALVGAGMVAAAPAGLAAVDEVDAAFLKFWTARNPQEAEAPAADVVNSGVRFDDAFMRLKQGRAYASAVPRGVVGLQRRAGGLDYSYNIEVPATYDPARRYQIRVQLHGGVMGRDTGAPRGAGTIGALAGAEQIYVIPFAWRNAPWWSTRQEENLTAILDSVKRTYNVDENRIALAGVSDGATAAYYLAMRQTTLFSSFLALNGNIMVLANDRLVPEDLFPNNLLNKPLFVVNGSLDRLYPAASVGPYVEHLQRRGVQVDYVVQPTGEHNTQWWPWMKGPFEDFVREHPRNPYPDRLTWETERPDVHNRAAWLVVDSLARDAQPPLPDVNEFPRELVLTFGVVGSGTRVSVIQPRSNAQRLGLRPGDVIVSVNGRELSRATELAGALKGVRAGDQLVIVVGRAGGRAEVRGAFQPDRPSSPDAAAGIVMFARSQPSGRVDLVRVGNTVNARTRGVAAFTLLLSPDAFDFSQPVRVVANGRVVFEGRVERNLTTLLKWAARDNDRTMLFAAELRIGI